MSHRLSVVVVLVVCFFVVVFRVVWLLRSKFTLRFIICKRSTSQPGGNQVDGLPPALSRGRVVAGRVVQTHRLGVSVCYRTAFAAPPWVRLGRFRLLS